MNWLLIVAFIIGMALLTWRESRARKKLWAKRRVENAESLGMTLPEYETWLKAVSPNRS